MAEANAPDAQFRSMERATLEMMASGVTSAAGYLDPTKLGLAKAELIRRDREYAEQQEQSRRSYEDQREANRLTSESEMFNASGKRAVIQQQQAEKLARM